MNWVLVLWYVTSHGVGSATVSHLSHDLCAKQALSIMARPEMPVVAMCIETKDK